jgi:RimJ/RimL family protein N-acetyltransferase
LWVIEHRETGSFLGDCGLTDQPVEEEQLLEVGYHLLAGLRGQGYAAEAGRESTAHPFDELDAPLVCSIVDPGNTSSRSVAPRLHALERIFTNASGQELWLYWSTPN